jgi:hypothetical protein
VYDPRYPDPLERRISSLGLSVINDVVTREAFSRNLFLIDLRVMFDADEDFANPIEPSVQGGLKLAHAIHRFASRPHGGMPKGIPPPKGGGGIALSKSQTRGAWVARIGYPVSHP